MFAFVLEINYIEISPHDLIDRRGYIVRFCFVSYIVARLVMWYVFHSSIQFGAKALIASAEAGNVDCMRLLLAAANADLELVDADVRVFDLNAYLHNEVSVSFLF